MTTDERTRGTLSVRQAAFIGVASMVGAGIFSLLGAAGEVAGSAVWVSFVLAGAVAVLQGYSFARIGSRYPSAGGLLEYVVRGFGNGHVTGVIAWLVLAVNAIITAMVAVSFGSYASAAIGVEDAVWSTKAFAALLIVAMTTLNALGSQAVARVQSVERSDPFLDARSARVLEADYRGSGVEGHVQHLADLVRDNSAQTAAENGEVLGEDEHRAAIDRAVSGDDCVAERAFVLYAETRRLVPDELIDLLEGAFVEQCIEPLPRRQFPLLVLAGDGTLTSCMQGLFA